MRNSLRLWLASCAVLLALAGCDSATKPANTSPATQSSGEAQGAGGVSNNTPVAADPSKSSQSENPVKTESEKGTTAKTSDATTANVAPAADSTAAAAPAPSKSEAVTQAPTKPESNAKTLVAKQNPEAATASETLSLIDLTALPRINEKVLLNQEPTYVYYSCNSSMAAVDAFYKAEFQSRGWKEIESVVTSNPEQYIDRNFSKNDFVIRFGANVGSTHGEVSVMLSNLGNIDVRLLPMMDDAELTPTSAVNAGHKTSSNIPDIADKLGKKMIDLGWQPTTDFHNVEAVVPHYRSLTFRKNAVRVVLGIVRDPQKPSEKTIVYYHAENVMPFDVPTVDSKQPLKLDTFSGRAAFETKLNRDQMVELLNNHAKRFDWTLTNSNQFVAKETHGLYIVTSKKRAIMARLVESNGVMSIDFERAEYQDPNDHASKPTSPSLAADSSPVIPTTTEPPTPQKSETDKTIEAFQSEINKTIDDELKKALGSLNAGPATAMDLNALKAKADALSKLHRADDDDDSDSPKNAPAVATNPFDVAEDSKQPTDADRKISATQCTITHGAQTYSLKHAVGYVKMEDGRPMKHIIFAEKPINVDKLKRMLQNNDSVHAFDVRTESFTPTLDVRVSGESVSINAAIGSSSISTNSSELRSTVTYRDGKLVGRIFNDEPMELGKEKLVIRAEVNMPVLRIEWQGVQDASTKKLFADATKEFPIPENYNNFSSEGTKYLKTVSAGVEAPIKKVEEFYESEFASRGWKERPKTAGQKTRKFSDGKEEIELELSASDQSTNIQLTVRNGVAAKADNMIPAAGKGMAMLGNLSDETIEVTVAGKVYTLNPGAGSAGPKDATRVMVDPGTCKIQFKSKKTGKVVTKSAEIPAGTTWGVLYDTGFQDVMRFF